MLVRLAARKETIHPQTGERSPEEIEEEQAATRIQSLYRGKKARQERNLRRSEATRGGRDVSKGRSDDNEGAASAMEAGKHPKLIGKSSTSSGANLLRPDDPMNDEAMKKLKSGSSMASDYNVIFEQLEKRPTTLPRWLQQQRISVYMLFEEPRSSYLAQAISIFILFMILISIVCFMAETMPELKRVPHELWLSIEVCCTGVFTVEYVMRFLTCGVAGVTQLQFVKNTMNIFDLLAILPFYISVAMQAGEMAKALGVLRTVRLVRLFRIFKLGRYSVGLRLMAQALRNSAQALWVLCFFLCVGILLFSSAVYYVEKMSCPDYDDLAAEPHRLDPTSGLTEWDRYVADCRVSNTGKHTTHGLCCDEYGSPLDFPSIVEAFWWSTVTMTTVGFGEVYPRTELGRMVATATMLSGILLIALPVAIIGRKFQEVYECEDRAKGDRQSESNFPSRPSDPSEDPAELAKSPSTPPVAPVPQRRPSLPRAQPSLPREAPETAVKAPEGPSLAEMSRKLRLMKLPDSGMTSTAIELAEELEEACDMQQEIISMEREEKARRAEVVDLFDGLLKRFGELLEPEGDAKKAKTAGLGVSKLSMMMFKKVGVQAEAAAAPPLPPPADAPPSDDRGSQPDDGGQKPVEAEASQAAPLPPGMVDAETSQAAAA